MEYFEIINKAWEDDNFKKELLENPKKVLQDKGFIFSENIKVIMHENNENELHFVLPAKTQGEMSEEELQAIAGGGTNWLTGTYLGSAFGDKSGVYLNPKDPRTRQT